MSKLPLSATAALFAIAVSALAQRPPPSPSSSPGRYFLGPTRWFAEADTEIIQATDIFVAESGMRFAHDWEAVRLDLDLSYARFNEDYEPATDFDPFGFPERLQEERFGGQGTIRPRIGDWLTFIATGGAYNGFQDYRRVWLANYYRQRYANPRFPPRPRYEEPDPKGWNIGGGLRWEYLPARGFLEFHLGYNVDDVAPGYIEDPATLIAIRGRETLYTRSMSISTENVFADWLRVLNELRASETTQRDPRYSWQGSVNVALGERLVVRSFGGYATEDPKFEAFWAGTAIEFDANRHCTFIASGHYYADTGEILDPFLLSSAAPGLESYYLAAGVRLTWPHVTIKLEGGPYFTDYDALAGGSLVFANLYRQRKWGLAQLSVSVAF